MAERGTSSPRAAELDMANAGPGRWRLVPRSVGDPLFRARMDRRAREGTAAG